MIAEVKKKQRFLIDVAIGAQMIADSIAAHGRKKNIGAHEFFLGQVRADVIKGKTVAAIEYSAYIDMAEKEIEKIREDIITKHQLTCAHVLHSIGKINT